jgi:hypothetical protein
VTKILFAPFSVLGGILAGALGKKAFDGLWRLLDEEPAPEPAWREVPWWKLIAALLLEGAVFRAVRGVFDRGARELFRRATGRWPGEERPEPT